MQIHQGEHDRVEHGQHLSHRREAHTTPILPPSVASRLGQWSRFSNVQGTQISCERGSGPQRFGESVGTCKLKTSKVMATANTPSLNASSLPVSFSPRVSCGSSIMLSPYRVAIVSQVLVLSLLKFKTSLLTAHIPFRHQGYSMAQHTHLSITLHQNKKII